MKILLVAERYWPEVGAAPSRLANMAEGLKGEGCEVDVLTSLPNYPKGKIYDGYRGRVCRHEIHNGIGLFRYWIYATISRNPLARILNMVSLAVTIWLFSFRRKRIKGYDAVVIQTPTLLVAASAMFLFKTLYSRKCVLNVSDIWPLTAVDLGAMAIGSRSYRFMAWLERYLYRKADGILGQSEEILNHVELEIMSLRGTWDSSLEKDSDEVLNSRMWQQNKRLFLYRNLQPTHVLPFRKKKHSPLRLVFCGMLGVAQDVAGIVRNVPFAKLGVEFHLLGGGKQYDEIRQYIADHPGSNVHAYGFVPKEEIADRMKDMDAGIVPLATRIRGAFPSKVFDIIPQGLPVLFCGGGEGASFIKEHHLGYVSTPGDYAALEGNIRRLRDMSSEDYEKLSAHCVRTSQDKLDFKKQIRECKAFLERITNCR